MCGIVGSYDPLSDHPVDRTVLALMNEAQHHRGPDEGGYHFDGSLGFGHRRLSIVDVATGQQPLFNEDRSVAVIFNGQIYNFPELFAELSRFGHRFRTRCDTEVIVHAWEEWGEACVSRFRGMFAFALWDRNDGTLFLARDRLGIKPLHYVLLPSGPLLFASELKGILAHSQVRAVVDPLAVEDYLAFGYVPDPRTIFAGIAKLPPAHTLTVRRGRPVPGPVPYWDVRFEADPTISEERAAEELVAGLREAVRLRLVSEVPLGAFLSGGVDSSGVVALMSQEARRSIDTCSIAFEDSRFDESVYAREVAEQYRSNHRVKLARLSGPGTADRLVSIFDEPFADSSALPTYLVSALARENMTVALSGDGGDEIFAGYRRYRMHCHEDAFRRLVPGPIRRPILGMLGRCYPRLGWAPRYLRAKTTFESLALDTVAGYCHGVSLTPEPLRTSLYAKSMLRDLAGYRAVEVFRHHARRGPMENSLALAQYLDLKTWLPGGILTKVDRASMAVSLEVRVPMLDHVFVEWAAQLPPRLLLRQGGGKHILRRALAPFFAPGFLDRPKQGFSVPMASWLRGELRGEMERAIASPLLADAGLLEVARLREIQAAHQSGRQDHAATLWSILMFEAFLRRQTAPLAKAA